MQDIVQLLDDRFGQVVDGLHGPIVAPRVLPSEQYRSVPPDVLRLWLHIRAIYGIPTLEAVTWLREFIGDRSAIEIGASHGVFGRELGVPRTDSFMQEREEVKAIYAATGQPRVGYARDVVQLEAIAAARRFKPDVVFGSWITQYGTSGQASMYGVDEEKLLKSPFLKAYVVYGAPSTHGQKRIIRRVPKGWSFRAVTAPGFISRGQVSAMFVWTRD